MRLWLNYQLMVATSFALTVQRNIDACRSNFKIHLQFFIKIKNSCNLVTKSIAKQNRYQWLRYSRVLLQLFPSSVSHAIVFCFCQSKAAPTRASNLCKLVCTNCLTTAADGTSMWRKPSGCSSYGVNFFNSFLEHALIELIFYCTFLLDV